MSEKVYGIDLNEKITPSKVREAIVSCFSAAHCADSGLGDDNKEISEIYCRQIVQKAFIDAGGDFENPTKESIEGAMNHLAEFAKNFRKPEVIKEHYEKIMSLVGKLK